MLKITVQDYISRQPKGEPVESDPFYLGLANRIAQATEKNGWLSRWPEAVVKNAILGIIDYYQDVIADAGVWRGFIDVCKSYYGKYLPFFPIDDDYLEYELNYQDVRFLLWYFISMMDDNSRLLDPLDKDVETCAYEWYKILESEYEEAPNPEGYHHWRELTGDHRLEKDELYKLSNWFLLHCWLTVPAYSSTLAQIFASMTEEDRRDITKVHERLEQSMMEDPTGPLALFIVEWMELIIRCKIPPYEHKESEDAPEHKYYTAFVNATGGKTIMFFDGYSQLNDFLIEKLGWESGREHLPMMKSSRNFILMVNKTKGMLAARDINECIKHPDNDQYDKAYAETHAIELLTERGKCPADLLKYLCENGCLPDASFPCTDNTGLVRDNWDFIARCYLQLYYRGD